LGKWGAGAKNNTKNRQRPNAPLQQRPSIPTSNTLSNESTYYTCSEVLNPPVEQEGKAFGFGIGAFLILPQCPSVQFTTHYNRKGANIYVHVYYVGIPN